MGKCIGKVFWQTRKGKLHRKVGSKGSPSACKTHLRKARAAAARKASR